MLPAFDAHVFHLLYAQEPGLLRAIMIAFSLVGGGWGIFAIVPLLVPLRTRRVAAWLVGTLLVTGVVVFALKAAVGRDRPFRVFTGLRALALDSPTDHSFPSGHAAGSFAFALFLACVLGDRDRRRRAAGMRRHAWLGGLAIAFASAVGVSRIVLGFHFPLDVLAGELVGGTLGVVGARLYLRAEARRSDASPPLSRRGTP